MESVTKNRQPDRVLLAMTQRAYGTDLVPQETVFSEITNGWFNVLYRTRLADGRTVALKIAPPSDVPVLTRETAMMRTELEAMRLIRENTRVPIPRVDYADLTHELVDADWFAMEFLAGQNFEEYMESGGSEDSIHSGYRQLGALNRQINQVRGPHFGPLLAKGSSSWREAFEVMVEEVLLDGERVGVDLGWDSDLIRQVVDNNGHALEEVSVPRLVEVDLWAKNSLIRRGKIVAVLDHERAIFGDPLMEAGFTGIDMPAFGDPTHFASGYGLEELTESQRIRRKLYSLHLTVIMVVETKYRGHTDPLVRDFAHRHLDMAMTTFLHRD